MNTHKISSFLKQLKGKLQTPHLKPLQHATLGCLLAVLCLFSACDIIEEGKYTDSTTPIVVDSTLPKILLEDFTAHKCVNCPEGAAMYHALQEQYHGKIIVVSIHGGSLSTPDAEYPTDFRTQDGARLIVDYKAELEGMPCALVSRRQYNEKLAMGRAMWAGAITEYWQTFATTPLKIDLRAYINPANNNEISVETQVDYLTPSNNKNLISVWIVEDGIVSPQSSINQPNYIPDYIHNNVLRYSFNGAYGENIGNENSIPAGYKWNKNYTYNVPADKWNVNNLRVVAFVYDEVTKVVRQAEEAKVDVVMGD